ncbi:insulinoma-associated protein 1 [Nematostella vectensis]|uniref:insulinoma-associated protein 1 n=1 Tax=Nematostella vectensis TaxID=45351 RepID=UPI002076F42F|nr:insulinoma-associated protein 1 [Nematostella vectensis]
MPRAFLVKKNKSVKSSGEKRSYPEDDYDPNFNYVDNRIFATSSAVTGIIHSPTECDKFPVLSSLTTMFTSTTASTSCTSAFKPFKTEKENSPKRHKSSVHSTEGKAEKPSKRESKMEFSPISRDLHNEKLTNEHGSVGGKTAVLEHKEFAIFSDKNDFPKPKGPLPQSQFICQLCSEVYSDPFSLAQHKCSGIQHTEHRCPECDKVFSCPANLASHRRWHRPRSPHDKKSSQPQKPVEKKKVESESESDSESDTEKKPGSPVVESELSPVGSSQGQFVCTVCNKTFRRKAYLRKHMNNHTDDRPYPCQYCGKVFRSLTNRAKHVLNHAVGPKTFTCNVCGNGFANKGGLDRHSRIHTGEIYSCKQCSSTFYSSPGLTRHINKCHPPENRQIVVLQVPVRQG